MLPVPAVTLAHHLAMIGDDDDVGSTKKKNPVSVSALTGQGANNAAQC